MNKKGVQVAHVCMCVRACVHACMHAFVCVCIYVLFVCVCVFMCICVCMHAHACMHMCQTTCEQKCVNINVIIQEMCVRGSENKNVITQECSPLCQTYKHGSLPEAYLYLAVLSPSDEPLGEMGLVACLLYTSPSPRDMTISRMPSSA